METCLKSFLQFLVSAYVFSHFSSFINIHMRLEEHNLPPHHVWGSEASLLGSVLASQHVGSRNRTKVLRLGSRHFYASSHLTGPGSQQFMYSEHQLLACVTNPPIPLVISFNALRSPFHSALAARPSIMKSYSCAFLQEHHSLTHTEAFYPFPTYSCIQPIK